MRTIVIGVTGSIAAYKACELVRQLVKNGDSVVTTGSDRYPRGLYIGKITGTGLDEAGVSRYATVQSEIRPGELEQIFIITHFEK